MLPSRILSSLATLVTVPLLAAPLSPVEMANPLQGTDSEHDFSHGNEYPAIALPFPMNTWAPYTQPVTDRAGSFYYQYSQNKIRGIRETHQPSPWIADYAAFALMPVSGKLAVTDEERASIFRHENEVALPSYYRVDCDTWQARAEVTPTERCARFRFTFNQPADSYVVVDAFPGGSSVELIPGENKITGIVHNNHGGVPANFASYFIIIFDQPFSAYGVWSPGSIRHGETILKTNRAGAFVKFDTSKSKVVECRVASSFISPEQALVTLQGEIGSADFETVRTRAEQRWNEALGRARVEGGSEEQQRTFYSALYRSIMFPHKFYEIDARDQKVYFSPFDGKLHSGVLYTDSGFWDTFRAAHPLYNLLFPEVSAEILQSVLNIYEQSGWLPEWVSPGHRNCMIGNHSFSLLTDGWMKGIRSFDPQKALDAMVHDAHAPGPLGSVGRDGSQYYWKLGYVPSPNVHEAAAKTLEYAYDDFCAAQLAKAIGRNAEAEEFAKAAMNYTNLFDRQLTFVRGRHEDGSWLEPFDPTEWGGPFTEGDSWQWTWSVLQDLPGLVQLMNGEGGFGAKLDAVLTAPNSFKVGSYGRPIHEMTEMVALDMGQYAHGNEPIHHMLYLYDYARQPWKAQSRLRTAMMKLYQATPDGMCGDEDTGQMSAWYVFSALGFYPVCPGTTAYMVGSPLFNRAELKLSGGKTFAVVAHHNALQRPYIHSATLNGTKLDRTFLNHDEIISGGELVFEMQSAPDYRWGTGADACPPSAVGSITTAKQ